MLTTVSIGFRQGLRAGQLFANEDHLPLTFDLPAGNRIEGWRAKGFSRAQAETGMMPRTSNGGVDEEPFREGAVIVRAVRAYSKPLIAGVRQHNIVVSNPSEEQTAVCNGICHNALRKVGFVGCLRVSHVTPSLELEQMLGLEGTGLAEAVNGPT
jgi:hypothetical protein